MKKSLSITIKTILIIILAVTVVCLAIIGSLFLLVIFMNSSLENPAIPEVRYGEFPFELVYEVDGETVTINDVYVCEYDGVGVNEGGKFVKWKCYIKNTEEEFIFIKETDGKKIYCTLGPPEYYMDDPDYDATIERSPVFYIEEKNEVGGISAYGVNWLTLRDLYNVRLISYALSEPIENNYK